MKVMKADKDDSVTAEVVLVTGCSSGIGKACCDRLGQSSRRVYGASRSETRSDRWTYVTMDVTDEASVESAVAEVMRREGRIDALVHCAGVSFAGPIEDTTLDEAKRHFDINFFGTVRAVRSVLPIMRRQGAGKIIVIGSIGGLIALPYLGHYCASKFALDGFVESLRPEIQPFGVQATVLHPGDLNTAIDANQVVSSNTNSGSPYREVFQRTVAFYGEAVKKARSPDGLARRVEKLLSRQRLPVRLIVGTPIEVLGVCSKSVLPARSFEYLLAKAYGPGTGARK